MTRPRTRRPAALLALVVLLSFATGCPPRTEEELEDWLDEAFGPFASFFYDFYEKESEQERASSDRRRKPEPILDRFVGFAGMQAGAFGFLVAPRPLRVPFTLELTGGVLIPEAIPFSDGLLWCLELDYRTAGGTSLDAFYLLCGNTGLGGITTFAADNAVTLPGSQQYAGVFEIDLQIEADGAEMIFRSRPHEPFGSAPWDEVDRTPYDGTPGPLYPSIGASNMNQGAFGGFDLGRILANGPPPPGQTPEEEAAEALWLAVEHQFEALYLIDGPSQDPAGGIAELDLAMADAESALALVEGVVDKKLRKKARKQIKKSRNGIKKVRKKVEQGKIAKASDKAIKTLAAEIKAFKLLTPFALR